jgi:hypothetical protein
MSKTANDAMNALEKLELRSMIDRRIAHASEFARQEAFYGVLTARLWSANQTFHAYPVSTHTHHI